jgi:hypothetical protein
VLCSALLLFSLLKTPGGKTKQNKAKQRRWLGGDNLPPLFTCEMSEAKKGQAEFVVVSATVGVRV